MSERRDRKRARKAQGHATAAPAPAVGEETMYRCRYFGFRETELRRALSRFVWRMEQPRQRVETASRVPIGTASRPM